MITTCDEIEPLLSAWLDEELTPDEAARVALHVETCAVCRADADGLRATSSAVGERFAELSAAAPPPPIPAAERAPWWRRAAPVAAAALLLWWMIGDERPAAELPTETANALAALLQSETLELVAEQADGVRVRSVFRRDGSVFTWEEEAGGYAGGGDANEVWLHVPDGGVAWAPRENGAWLPARARSRWPVPLGPTGRAVLEELELAAWLAAEEGRPERLRAPDGSAWGRAKVVRADEDGSRAVVLTLAGGGTWRLEARSVSPAPSFHLPEHVLWDPDDVHDAAFPEQGLPPWLVTSPVREPQELEQLTGLGYLGDD